MELVYNLLIGIGCGIIGSIPALLYIKAIVDKHKQKAVITFHRFDDGDVIASLDIWGHPDNNQLQEIRSILVDVINQCYDERVEDGDEWKHL